MVEINSFKATYQTESDPYTTDPPEAVAEKPAPDLIEARKKMFGRLKFIIPGLALVMLPIFILIGRSFGSLKIAETTFLAFFSLIWITSTRPNHSGGFGQIP